MLSIGWVATPSAGATVRSQWLRSAESATICRRRCELLPNKLSLGVLYVFAGAKADGGAEPRRRQPRPRSKGSTPKLHPRPPGVNDPKQTASGTSPAVPALSEEDQRVAKEQATQRIHELGHQHLSEPLHVEATVYNPKRRLFQVMLCSEATLGDCEEFTKVLLADQTWDHGLDIQSLEVSSPGVHDVLEQDQAFRAFRSFPVVVTFQEEHPKYGLTLEGNLVDRDETFVRIRQGGRVLELERTAVREVRLVPAEDGDNL